MDMIHRHIDGSTLRLTLAAYKGYEVAGFVSDLLQACVIPQVAQKSRCSMIDGRTIRHKGYVLSHKHRNKIEEPFGGAKTFGVMA